MVSLGVNDVDVGAAQKQQTPSEHRRRAVRWASQNSETAARGSVGAAAQNIEHAAHDLLLQTMAMGRPLRAVFWRQSQQGKARGRERKTGVPCATELDHGEGWRMGAAGMQQREGLDHGEGALALVLPARRGTAVEKRSSAMVAGGARLGREHGEGAGFHGEEGEEGCAPMDQSSPTPWTAEGNTDENGGALASCCWRKKEQGAPWLVEGRSSRPWGRGGSRPGRHGEEHDSLLLLPWEDCCVMEKKTGRLWRLEKMEGWECKIAQVQRSPRVRFFSWAKWAGLEWAWPKTRNRVALIYFLE